MGASSTQVRSAKELLGHDTGELLTMLETGADGLSETQAAQRRLVAGVNEPSVASRGISSALLSLALNPLVLILLLSATVSAFLGDRVGATIIVCMVLLSSALDYVLAFHSQRAAARLREEVAPTATVRRDGAWQEIARRDLVPGDIVRLSAGDRVPADLRLLEGRDLHVQQAALTGESMPAEKEPLIAAFPNMPIMEARCNLFLGTSVLAGTGTGVVAATGRATAFGDIAATLSARPPPTDFERGLQTFARFIMSVVVFLVLFVMLASVALGRPGLQSLLFAVALAVGLTPEFMPMIMTVTLARGAMRMARQRVIVKHLAAIEGFGGMTVLLSDKTGTLTSGEMTLQASTDASGHAAERPLQLAWLNSRNETGIRSPLDTAILAAHTHVDGYPKLDEIPFDFERRRLSVVLEEDNSALLIAKGAPESVLGICVQCERDGEVLALDDKSRAAAEGFHRECGERGLRVLAVAYRRLPRASRYTAVDECDMVLAGFLAFADPPIPGVAESIAALARDGVTVKVVTGDDQRVAQHVCEQAGLDTGRIVLGTDLDAMTDVALGALAQRSTVFARMLPAHKHRLVAALKQRGEVVGFLGDGVNDAPSLHAADVGISVSNAVDVAKDAADIILRERDLRVLHEGIIEGRRAFANVMKYLLMGTSSNFGNMFSMAAGVLFLPFLPMLPIQILLNNFLYDLAQVTIPTDNVDAEQLRKPQRWDIRLIRNFMLLIGPISSLYDFLTFFALLAWLRATEAEFHTGWFVESLATQTLVLFVIRTFANPMRSRPSVALTISTLAVVMIAALIPFVPWAATFGFVPLPPAFFAFVALAAGTYLGIVEIAKRWLVRHAHVVVPA